MDYVILQNGKRDTETQQVKKREIERVSEKGRARERERQREREGWWRCLYGCGL